MYSICLTSTGEYPNRREDALLEEQIQKMGRGDKDALRMLYEKTHASVYGFALSVVKNTHDAEDILQETYLRMYASAPTYQSSGKPMAWVFTITRNLALMKLRDRKKTEELSEETWEQYAAQQPGITNEDRLVLSSVLQALSDEESQIVMLHAVTGFKHREIADLLQLPLSTVLSKYNRARKKLQQKLTEGG